MRTVSVPDVFAGKRRCRAMRSAEASKASMPGRRLATFAPVTRPFSTCITMVKVCSPVAAPDAAEDGWAAGGWAEAASVFCRAIVASLSFGFVEEGSGVGGGGSGGAATDSLLFVASVSALNCSRGGRRSSLRSLPATTVVAAPDEALTELSVCEEAGASGAGFVEVSLTSTVDELEEARVSRLPNEFVVNAITAGTLNNNKTAAPANSIRFLLLTAERFGVAAIIAAAVVGGNGGKARMLSASGSALSPSMNSCEVGGRNTLVSRPSPTLLISGVATAAGGSSISQQSKSCVTTFCKELSIDCADGTISGLKLKAAFGCEIAMQTA